VDDPRVEARVAHVKAHGLEVVGSRCHHST
jgi:hypothetical protein